MKKLPLLFSLCLLSLAACTAAPPPAYNLPAPNTIAAGAKYTVRANENIYTIAQKNRVNMRETIALNRLVPPFALKPGQVITLPAKRGNGEGPASILPEGPSVDSAFNAVDVSGGSTWQDTNSQAKSTLPTARSAGVESVTAQPLAPIDVTQTKDSESPLIIEGKKQETAKPSIETPKQNFNTAPPKEEPQDTIHQPLTVIEGPLPSQYSKGYAERRAAEAKEIEAEIQKTQNEATQTDATQSGQDLVFGWPVQGTIISTFGPKGRGLDNDGINITAPKNSAVKAAEAGIVAYTGDDMKGFGNLILIRHRGGWVTAYAHLGRIIVEKDTIVAKGDMIGAVGTTGGVASPQLHFETRRDGKPVDPELMMH